MKLGNDHLKIHSDLTDVYGANCVLYCTICRWIERFRAGKVSFEDGHHLGCAVLVRNEQTVVFMKKLIEQDPRVTILEIHERCDVSINTTEKNCA